MSSAMDFAMEKHGESYWTKEAIIFGKKLVTILLDIDKSLRLASTATPPPSWANNPEFISPQEEKILKAIDDKAKEIEKLKAEEHSLQADLRRERQLKDLLFETGKPLEAAVISALEALGYSAENYDDGELELDQVIVSSASTPSRSV